MRVARRFVAGGEPLEARSLLSQFGPSTAPEARPDGYGAGRQAEVIQQVQAGQGSGVVFLGDSITDNWANWGQVGVSTWDARLAPLGAADFAIAGNTTQNVLWQIQQGDLAGQPRVVALMIGTNNLGLGGSVAQTIRGVDAVVAAIHRASPGSAILLQGILPRGSGAADGLSLEIDQVNAAISGLASTDPTVRYVDFGSSFVAADGSIPAALMPDHLHPSAPGYQIWADAVLPTLDAMLAQSAPTSTTVAAPTATASTAPASRPAAPASTTATVPTDLDPAPPPPLFLIAPGLDPGLAPPILPGSTAPSAGQRARPASLPPIDPFI